MTGLRDDPQAPRGRTQSGPVSCRLPSGVFVRKEDLGMWLSW